MIRTLALPAILFTVAAHCAEPAQDGVARELRAPKVKILAAGLTDGQYYISCEATNPNMSPVMFVGYRADAFDPPIEEGRISPIHRVEFQRDGKWEEHPIGWCGTGIDGIELAPLKKPQFGIVAPADGKATAVRIGISWSKPIDFATAEPGAFSIAWSEPLDLKGLVETGPVKSP
jgi:hypothetical protein